MKPERNLNFLEKILAAKDGEVVLLQTSTEYCYLLCKRPYYYMLEKDFKGNSIIPSQYGKILYRGHGYPPKVIKDKIKAEY
jgi:hypothetical protein